MDVFQWLFVFHNGGLSMAVCVLQKRSFNGSLQGHGHLLVAMQVIPLDHVLVQRFVAFF